MLRIVKHRVRPRTILGLMGVLLAGAFAAGCGDSDDSSSSGASTTAGPKPVLRIGLAAMPQNLDPSQQGNNTELTTVSLSNESLIHMNADRSLSPGLALEWGYVGDANTVFELTLREDAAFSDGTPVTADAVKKWIEYFAGAGGPLAGQMGQLRSVRATDRFTVRITLGAPNPIVGQVLSDQFNWGAVASPRAVARGRRFLANNTAGAGPYQLVKSESQAGTQYVYEPNPHYYDPDRIRFSKVIVKGYAGPSSTMLNAIKTGQMEVAWGDPLTVSGAESAGLTVTKTPQSTQCLCFLDRSGRLSRPLADVRVRQAMNYALDRRAIAKAIIDDEDAATSINRTPDGYVPELRDYYPYDPAKARELLAEAGYADGFTLPVITLGGFGGNLGDPVILAAGRYLQDVGIRLDLESPASYPEYLASVGSGRFPALQIGYASPVWSYYILMLMPNGPLNFGGWSDPTIDRLWAKGSRQTEDEAIPTWQAIMRQTVTEAVNVPLFDSAQLWYSHADEVTGIEGSKDGVIPLPAFWSAAGSDDGDS